MSRCVDLIVFAFAGFMGLYRRSDISICSSKPCGFRWRMVVTKEKDETAGQWSNAAVKKKLCPSQRQRDMGIKCRSNGSGASPNCRCRLLAVEVDPAVQTSKLMQRKGQMANR